MLDGLDDVRWHELRHAYGPASDVPDQIRALVSPQAEVREQALWKLYGNIWHQHTVYEATSHAVPFLIEVATARDVPEGTRAGVTQLLADIADGSSYVDVHAHLFPDMEFEEGQVDRELEWVRSARDAVRNGLPALTAPLDPGSPRDLQASAVYVAAMFPEDTSTLTPRIRAVRDAAGDRRLERGADLALALLGERAMPEALAVASTDERGRPEAVSFEEDGERVDQLASSKLHDTLFGDE